MRRRHFLQTVEGLAVYFRKSMKCNNLLVEVVKLCITWAAATGWNSNSRLVQTIKFYHEGLYELLTLTLKIHDDWDGEPLTMASGFNLWLSKSSTCFLLMAYSVIFTETEALFCVFQTKVMDI